MTPLELSILLALAFIGSFIQALTGFALGLIVLGTATLLDLASIPFIAAVVSMISLVNGAWVLGRHPREIEWRQVGWITLGLAPMIAVGMALLAYLDTTLPMFLRQLLGAVIVAAAVLLFMRPHPLIQASGSVPTILSGLAGGVLGGLFSTAGPPIVFHIYRQPWRMAQIRSTLLTVFILATLLRIGVQIARGELEWKMVEAALWCVIPVIVAAQLGARTTRHIPLLQMRRLAFALLAISGAGLLYPVH